MERVISVFSKFAWAVSFIIICLIAELSIAATFDFESLQTLNKEAKETYNFIATQNTLKGQSYPWRNLNSVSDTRLKAFYNNVRAYMSSVDLSYSVKELTQARAGEAYHPLLIQVLVDLVVQGYPYMGFYGGGLFSTRRVDSTTSYDFSPEIGLLRSIYPNLFVFPDNVRFSNEYEMDFYKNAPYNRNTSLQKPKFQLRKISLMALAHLGPIMYKNGFSCQFFGLLPRTNAQVIYSTYVYSNYISFWKREILYDEEIYLTELIETKLAKMARDKCLPSKLLEVYDTNASINETIGQNIQAREFELAKKGRASQTPDGMYATFRLLSGQQSESMKQSHILIEEAVEDLQSVYKYSERVSDYYE